MSAKKENNEVAVDKVDNDKSAGDAKCELKGTKRTAVEVSVTTINYYFDLIRHL